MNRAAKLLLGMSAVMAGLAAGIWFGYRSDLRHAREAISHGSALIDLDDGPVEYADRGTGVPLLSIHGAGGGFDQGLANAVTLAGAGFRIIAPSRFGYLRTPARSSAATQAEAHAALLARLGVDCVIVLGVSAGARSAVELALADPDKVAALILVVPALEVPDNPVAIEPSAGSRVAFWMVNAGGDFLWWATKKVAPSVLIRFLGVPPGLLDTASDAERARIAGIVESVEPLSARVRGINIDSEPPPPSPALENIRTPTLVIAARDDLFNTLPAAEMAARRISGARLIVHDTGGHLLVGRTQENRAAVHTFLADAGRVSATGSAPSQDRRLAAENRRCDLSP